MRSFDELSGDETDRTVFEEAVLLDIAKTGVYMEFDLFGVEVSHYQLNEHIDMPSDAQRIGCHLSRR